MNPEKLIDCINKKCKKSINPAFNLSLFNKNYKFIHYTINGIFSAVNRDESVKVLNWFDNFWLFLEIKFENIYRKEGQQIIISLSVFQG
jgi:hypothetical protein